MHNGTRHRGWCEQQASQKHTERGASNQEPGMHHVILLINNLNCSVHGQITENTRIYRNKISNMRPEIFSTFPSLLARLSCLFVVLLMQNQNACGFLVPTSRLRRASLRLPPRAQLSNTKVASQATVTPAVLQSGTAGYFQFQGHNVFSTVYQGKPNKPAVILVHGFGCSSLYWRETIQALQSNGYTVHAIDLLGQGKSDKPGRKVGIEYSIDLWAKQIDEYAQSQVKATEMYLMGNSLGSVVALNAATGDFAADSENSTYLRSRVKGIGMFNCGIGMNSRNILLDYSGIQKAVFTALFDLFDILIFDSIPLLTYVLDKVVTQELLRNALTGLYQYADDPNARVDDALVDSFYYPAKDPGSPETLSQIYTNNPGKTPMVLYQEHIVFLQTQVPIHLVWGKQDGVTPLQGPVGQFFQNLSDDPTTNVSLDAIDGAGHIPFDEVPLCNDLMVNWLNMQTSIAAAAQQRKEKGMPAFFGDFKLPFL